MTIVDMPTDEEYAVWDKMLEDLEARIRNCKELPEQTRDFMVNFLLIATAACGYESMDHRFFQHVDINLTQFVTILEEVNQGMLDF